MNFYGFRNLDIQLILAIIFVVTLAWLFIGSFIGSLIHSINVKLLGKKYNVDKWKDDLAGVKKTPLNYILYALEMFCFSIVILLTLINTPGQFQDDAMRGIRLIRVGIIITTVLGIIIFVIGMYH